MNGFQLIFGTALLLALARELFAPRLPLSWKPRLARSLVWTAAIVAIARPDWVTRFANLLGVGRGADIVLYIFALACVVLAFYFYAQQLRLRRELSLLAGQIAIRNARFGSHQSPVGSRQND